MNINYATLDHGLGEEIDMLRSMVNKFAQAEIAPRAMSIDKSNDFPTDLWMKMETSASLVSPHLKNSAEAIWAILHIL